MNTFLNEYLYKYLHNIVTNLKKLLTLAVTVTQRTVYNKTSTAITGIKLTKTKAYKVQITHRLPVSVTGQSSASSQPTYSVLSRQQGSATLVDG